jgi:hypothetical protein
MPLRAVLYREENRWVAHCLEFDLCGDGEEREEALIQLCECIVAQVQASIKHKNIAALFSPAEGRFFEMFAGGTRFDSKSCAAINLQIKANPVAIEEVKAREYADADHLGVNADLVPT